FNRSRSDTQSAPGVQAQQADGHISDAIEQRVGHAHLELIPTPKAHLQFEHLPSGSTVSVTASPAKDLQATLDMAAQLLDLGHTVIPHLAARMVEGPEHVATLANWFAGHGVTDAFVIGGDAPTPFGPYLDAAALIRELLDSNANLQRIGFGGYPDGHASIPSPALAAALLEKQDLLTSAGVDGWISTQMCFDSRTIVRWIEGSRAAGLELLVHLGIPGVIDTMKLLTMGTKLGVGASLRYLRKNRAVVSKLAAPGGYDPMDMLEPMAADLDRLGVEALHVFTFNQVANTVEWQMAVGGAVSSAS
ncbi:MAG: metF, partial [Ilumatobacteraceae bacterium]|nr:metF [Ilumatobacteraceae bacterium]